MRIISSYKDYYDGYSERSNTDYITKVWVREEKEIKLHKSKVVILEERSKNAGHYSIYANRYGRFLVPGYLILAGKVYPFLRNNLYGSKEVPLYLKEDEIKPYYYSPVKEPEKYQPFFRKHWNKKNSEEFFVEYPDMSDLCMELNTPIILFYPSYYNRDKETKIVSVNVNLKDLDFSKILDAPSVYQVLDLFVSNILVKDEMPMSPMSDIEKVESHGFDKKTSFRKEKGK